MVQIAKRSENGDTDTDVLVMTMVFIFLTAMMMRIIFLRCRRSNTVNLKTIIKTKQYIVSSVKKYPYRCDFRLSTLPALALALAPLDFKHGLSVHCFRSASPRATNHHFNCNSNGKRNHISFTLRHLSRIPRKCSHPNRRHNERALGKFNFHRLKL